MAQCPDLTRVVLELQQSLRTVQADQAQYYDIMINKGASLTLRTQQTAQVVWLKPNLKPRLVRLTYTKKMELSPEGAGYN